MSGQYGNTSSPDDTWNFIEGTPYNVGVEEDDSICKDWEDTIVILKENLRIAGVGERWLRPLSAYLYSAYINQVDLLLAGPNGEEIANAFSIAVSGNQASKIVCAGKMSSQAVQLANDSSASVVTVENPFHPDWISHIPHYSRQPKIKKQMHIWVHPFMEDLSLEPAGLYNYVLPVFTEVFIEQAPVQQAYSVSRNNPEYVQFTSTRSNPAHANLIKNLGVSKLQVEKLRRVIRDAKEIANIINLDIEYLFGVLPLSILLDKKDFLQEALGGEKNLSAAVRKEIQRYVDGE
jgi:hypothetical protein